MKKKKLPIWAALALVVLYLLFGMGHDIPEAADPVYPTGSITGETLPPDCTGESAHSAGSEDTSAPTELLELLEVREEGHFTGKEEVALYIHTYGHLPDNFITKDEARDLGWEGGGLEDYAPGMCIGGDRFGNYEGLLPDAPGRTWTECDIDTLGKDSRGAKRIVFSSDGLIYYTDDHYESFELLYGEP